MKESSSYSAYLVHENLQNWFIWIAVNNLDLISFIVFNSQYRVLRSYGSCIPYTTREMSIDCAELPLLKRQRQFFSEADAAYGFNSYRLSILGVDLSECSSSDCYSCITSLLYFASAWITPCLSHKLIFSRFSATFQPVITRLSSIRDGKNLTHYPLPWGKSPLSACYAR